MNPVYGQAGINHSPSAFAGKLPVSVRDTRPELDARAFKPVFAFNPA